MLTLALWAPKTQTKRVTEITATCSAIIFLKRREGVLDNYVLRKNHCGEEKASLSNQEGAEHKFYCAGLSGDKGSNTPPGTVPWMTLRRKKDKSSFMGRKCL